MQLQELTLRNFCQHVETAVKFGSGLTAITGPNGCGKSNLVAALQYAALGTDPNYGRLSDSVNWTAKRGAPADVCLKFSHGSADYTVSRSLKSGPHLLYRGDEKIAEGSKPVTEQMLAMLATTPALLSDYVLVRQGDIASWFRKSPAERAAEIGALLRLDAVERLHDTVGRWLGGVVMPPQGEDPHDVHNQLLAAEDAMAVFNLDPSNQALSQLTWAMLQEQSRHAQQVINECHQHARVRQNVRNADVAVHSATESLTAAEQDLVRKQQDLNDLEAAAGQFREKFAAAEAAKQQWTAYRNSETMRRMVEAKRRELAEFVMPPEVPEVSVVSFVDAQTALSDARSYANRAAESLRAIADMREGDNCPTCGQVILHDSDCAAAFRNAHNEAEAAQQQLAAAMQAYNTSYDGYTKYNTYTKACNVRTQLATSLAQVEAAYKAVTIPSMQEQTAQDWLDQQDMQQQAINIVRTEVATADARAHERRTALSGAIASQQQRQAELAACVWHTDENEAAAKQTLAESAAKLQQFTAYTQQQTRLVAAVDSLAERHTAAVKAADKHRKATAATEHIQAVRNVFHKDQAPKRLAERQLHLLVAVTNQTLVECGVPFTVEAADKFGLNAVFPGGKTADRRLSGGQLSMLGLVFRTAVSAMLLPDIGMLWLDEPTEFIDEDNRDRLPMIFRRLREVSAATGLQLVVITHDSRILPTFDQVISL